MQQCFQFVTPFRQFSDDFQCNYYCVLPIEFLVSLLVQFSLLSPLGYILTERKFYFKQEIISMVFIFYQTQTILPYNNFIVKFLCFIVEKFSSKTIFFYNS